MDRSELERLIDEKITEHERRFGWVGGVATVLIITSFIFLK